MINIAEVVINAKNVADRLPYLQAQAERALADQPAWNDHRLERRIVNDFKDCISYSEEFFEQQKNHELIYQFFATEINNARESENMVTYFIEKSAIKALADKLGRITDNNSSEHSNTRQEVTQQQNKNSQLLTTVADEMLDTNKLSVEKKDAYLALCIQESKKKVLPDLISKSFKEGETFQLQLNSQTPAETAHIWTNARSDLLQKDQLDILSAIFRAAVDPTAIKPQKGFIKNRKLWLGVQPYVSINATGIESIKTNASNKRAQDEAVNDSMLYNFDATCDMLRDSLQYAKYACDYDDIDSVLFLTQTVQNETNGPIAKGHIECFQITKHANGGFILHEANSSTIDKQTIDPQTVCGITNSDTIKYVLAKAEEAGFNIVEIKRSTVYRQYSDQGCGFCAVQTAIDSFSQNKNISELDPHETSAQDTESNLRLEEKLRLNQIASLFQLSDSDIQDLLAQGFVSQYITLNPQDENQREKATPPTPDMLKPYVKSYHSNDSQSRLIERMDASKQAKDRYCLLIFAKVIVQLTLLRQEGDNLETHSQKKIAIDTICQSILREIDSIALYCDPVGDKISRDLARFKTESINIINRESGPIDTLSGQTILANLVIAILTCGIAFLVNKALYGDYLFFIPEESIKINDIKQDIINLTDNKPYR